MKTSTEENQTFIHFEEDLLSTNVQELRSELKIICEKIEGSNLIIDLSKCKIIDSQGLNLLIGLYKEAVNKQCKFKVTGASTANLRLFSIFKLKERFGITD